MPGKQPKQPLFERLREAFFLSFVSYKHLFLPDTFSQWRMARRPKNESRGVFDMEDSGAERVFVMEDRNAGSVFDMEDRSGEVSLTQKAGVQGVSLIWETVGRETGGGEEFC